MQVLERGYIDSSQRIRGRITDGTLIPGVPNTARLKEAEGDKKAGWFIDNALENRIQPGSHDTIVSKEAYALDTDEGVLRQGREKTVRRALLEIPKRQRQQINIKDGFEIKKDHSYLVRLEDQVVLKPDERIISSPKSSIGRLFTSTRLMADFNPCFDEVSGVYNPDEPLNLWLLIQPTQFNLVLHSGISLNQLIFGTGEDLKLSEREIREEIEKRKILHKMDKNGNLSPTEHIINGGLQIHLDLIGEHTEGVAGLKARDNPNPIDLSKKGHYVPEEYFAPIIPKNEPITVENRDRLLLVSKEILSLPPHLSSGLGKYIPVGVTGSLHDAEVADNNFRGPLLYQVRLNELSKTSLSDGLPMSRLHFLKTSEVPDKLYGDEKTGSNYQNQRGPRVSKHFKNFDFKKAAKNHEKLDRMVLTQDAKILLKHRVAEEGFEPIRGINQEALFQDIGDGFFHSRYDCEDDRSILQPISYCVIFGPDRKVFAYRRAKDIRNYGDERLFGKFSVGVGGHVRKTDGPPLKYMITSLNRERKQEVAITGEPTEPQLMGTLMARDKEVDNVHFGLIYAMHTTGTVTPNEASIPYGKMFSINDLNAKNPIRETEVFGEGEWETWSKILIPFLDPFYDQTKP